MRDRGGNIKRQIVFNHSEEAIQDVSSHTSFISDPSGVTQLSCLVDFTQPQNPDVKLIGTNQIFFLVSA